MDPEGDGNCGYRCVAWQVYNDENKWREVREEMANKLVEMKGKFMKLMGIKTKKAFEEEVTKIKPVDGPASKSKWLSKLDHGQLLAECFERPICFYSLNDSHTFVPHSSPPKSISPIFLSFVNSSHWVSLVPKTSQFPLCQPL